MIDTPPKQPRASFQDEPARLKALRQYQILDTPRDPAFDDLTALTAQLTKTPIALITLLDDARQWFKSSYGVEWSATPRNESFCQHAIQSQDLLIVPDATLDPRFSNLDMVKQKEGIRFYAGAPLITPEGHVLGTLCVLDRTPRQLDTFFTQVLKSLSRQVVQLLELHRKSDALSKAALRLSNAEEQTFLHARSYAIVMEGIRDGLWDWDLKTNSVYYSTQWKTMLGYQENEIENHFDSWARLVHPEDLPACLSYIQSYQRGEIQDYEMEHRLRHKDGHYRWILTRGVAVKDQRGQPVRMVGSHTDITQRKEHESALSAQRRAMEAASDGIALLNSESTYVYLNPAHAHLFGYESPAELLGKTWQDLYTPEERERIQKEVLPRLLIEGRWQGEAMARRKDGSTFHEGLSLTLVEDGGLVCVCRDITQEKAAELEVRKLNLELERRVAERTAELSEKTRLVAESELRLRLITDRIPQIFWIRHLGPPQTVFASPAYETIWGKTLDSLRQNPASFLDSVYEPDRPRVASSLVRQNHGENTEEHYRIRRADGSLRWIWDRGFPIRNAQGIVLHVCGLAEDITERKLAEEQSLLYQQQLRIMASKLLRSEEFERRRIATDIHDQIGQSLAVCRMKVDELASSNASTQLQHNGAGRQTLEQVSQMLGKMIHETRTLTFQLSPPILHELGLAQALQWLAEKNHSNEGLRVLYQGPASVEPLHSDLRMLLFRIASELLANTIKHAQARSAFIQLERHEETIELAVRDDGRGFGDAASQQNKLAGFGLFSIRDRLRFIGGQLEITSKANKGTTARVTAPLRLTDEGSTISSS